MPSFKIPLLSRYVQHILRPDIYELSFFKSWWVSPALIILYLLKGWSVSIVQYEILERCSVLFTTTHAVVILLKPCPTCVVLYVRPVRHVLSFMSVLLDMCCPLCSSGPTHVVLYVSPVRHVLSFIMSCQICVVLYESPVRHVLSFTQILSDTCCPLGLSYQTFVVLYLSPLDTCCP